MSNYKTLILINSDSPETTPDMVEARIRDVQRRLETAQVQLIMLAGLPGETSGMQYALFASEDEFDASLSKDLMRVLPMNVSELEFDKIYREIKFETSRSNPYNSIRATWTRGRHPSGIDLTIDLHRDAYHNRILCAEAIATLVTNGITKLYHGQEPHVDEEPKHELSCPRCGYPGPIKKRPALAR